MGKMCSVQFCEEESNWLGLCAKHHYRLVTHGTTDKRGYHGNSKKIEFEVNENGCFECTSHAFNRYGYPEVSRNGQKRMMSRLVYTEMFGEIPKGMVVRHKCDNPACINPEHLTIGTKKDNTMDMVMRGRTRSLFNEDQVREIKRLFAETDLSNPQIAKMFSVHRSLIYGMRIGKTWKHIHYEGDKRGIE